MDKNIMIFKLLQNFISQEEITEILAEFGFEDTALKCDVSPLLKNAEITLYRDIYNATSNNVVLFDYIETYRAWYKAADQVIILIRKNHKDMFENRSDSALKQRISQLEKVTAGIMDGEAL